MSNDERNELKEILQAVEAARLDIKGLMQWAEGKGLTLKGPQIYNWWSYQAPHGLVAYSFQGFDSGSWILFCTYRPESTKRHINVVFRGTTASGLRMPRADWESLFSPYQIEDRVKFVCVAEADWAMDPAEVTSETRIVEDLLEEEDEEVKRDFVKDVFLELGLWFDFDSPDLDQTLDSFGTVGDVIRQVQRNYRAGDLSYAFAMGR